MRYTLTCNRTLFLIPLMAGFFLIGSTLASNKISSINPQTAFTDETFNPLIRTVKLHRMDQSMTQPVIAFRSNEQLQLSFDDLEGEVKNYKYTVVHCDAYWNKSNLWPNDYIDGFPESYIENYNFSFNTLQPYIHYSLAIPNENLRFTLPGNYVLIVYMGNDPDEAILTKRFMVLDQKVTIDGKVRLPVAGADRLKKHEISFTVETGNLIIRDQQRSLHVFVSQNGRWDNALDLQPVMTRGNVLDYQLVDGLNSFDAVNEFRALDIRSSKSLSASLIEITRDEMGYNAYLWPDKRRSTKPYVTENDLNGRFDIYTSEGSDPNSEAEYVRVHFALELETPIPGADVYIIGMLSDWQFRDENRMRYNGRKKVYEKSMLLKQGYYNYHYALLNKGEHMANPGFFEGNHATTGNEYTVYVYYCQPGQQYDSLIGIRTFNSKDYF